MEAHHHLHQQDKEAKQLASPSSSPSHEFSFTISLHSSSSTTTTNNHDKYNSLPPSSSLAVDLSPADDIFFHGHLLPLHLLSHLSSSSPRFSTTSMDSFALPNIRDLLEDEKSCGTSNRSNISIDSITNNNSYIEELNNKQRVMMTREESKSNNKHSFSLFGGLTKGRKGCQVLTDDHNKEDKEKQKRKQGFDMIHALKKYLRMVQHPLVHFRTGRRSEKNIGLLDNHGKPYSHSSGNLMMKRNKPELMRGRRGEFSAPASMRTSPTNSGLLLAATTTTLPPTTSDSTMEELQAAIQAAIAHCKNSIAKEEKLKC